MRPGAVVDLGAHRHSLDRFTRKEGMCNPYALLADYELHHLPVHLVASDLWNESESLLTDLFFLEAKTDAGLVLALAGDFTAVVNGLPADRPLLRILRLLEEALRRDIHFIARHPTALFQCLWNSCWWFDSSEASRHYDPPEIGWPEHPPWDRPEPKLSTLLERWRSARNNRSRPWLRSLRPPALPLGSTQHAAFRGHEGWVRSVALAPDGRRVVSASADRTARVCDVASGQELICFRNHAAEVDGVVFSPDGRRVASASRDGTIRIWDAAHGSEILEIRAPEGRVAAVVFSPEGSRVAAGCTDWTVRVWETATGIEQVCFRSHEGLVEGVAFSPDGRWIVSGASGDPRARVWDASTGAERSFLAGHEKGVTGVAYSPNGLHITTADLARTIRVWDATNGVEQGRFSAQEDGSVPCLAFCPDSRHLVAGSGGWLNDHSVRVWDVARGVRVRLFLGHENDITGVAVAPDGRRIVSGSLDGTVRIWEMAAGEPALLREHEPWGDIWVVAFSPDGARILTASMDQTVRVWHSATGVEQRCFDWHRSESWTNMTALFSPDGRRIASAGGEKVCLWDVDDRGDVLCLEGHHGPVGSLAFSPDGQRVLSGGERDGTVRVWDATTGVGLLCLRVNAVTLSAVAYSPDGRRIAASSYDGTVQVWDADDGREQVCFRGHSKRAQGVAFTPDSQHVASGSLDGTVRVWDALTGQERRCLTGHDGGVRRMAFSSDSRYLAVAAADGTVRLWDAEEGICLKRVSGRTDVGALAAGAASFPYQVVGHSLETIVKSSTTDTVVAWFPVALERIVTHPSMCAWAGTDGSHFHLFTLQGGD